MKWGSLARLTLLCAVLFIGCYSGADLTPREFNAIQRSAATLSPAPLAAERGTAAGTALGAAAAEGTWQLLHGGSDEVNPPYSVEDRKRREEKLKRQQQQLEHQGKMLEEIDAANQ